MQPGDARLRRAAWLAFAGYAVLYGFNELGRPVPCLRYLQQTLVSVVFAGLISSTLAGFGGLREWVLEHPVVQHIGQLSFGLYLFHTPVPLFLGIVAPQLWDGFFTGPWQLIRLAAFALVSWGLAWLCWRFLEIQTPHVSRHAASSSPDR